MVTYRAVALRPMARAHLSTAALMPAEPSHPVAVPRTAGTTIPHSQGHRAGEGGSTLYVGISQPLFVTVRLPGSNGARLRPARAQGPKVRRLAAGGRWIRTIGPRHERADFCCGRRIAGPNGGAKKGCFLCGTDGSNPSPFEHSRLPLAWHDQRTVLGFA
jgi:hypothetical protein